MAETVSCVLQFGIERATMSEEANEVVPEPAPQPTSYAVVRASDGKVVTFVRSDYPDGWEPGEGLTLVADTDLPAGWEWAPPELGPVPQQISARQIRMWLVTHGISLAAVETVIDNIADPLERDVVRVEWEYAPYVERKHPMIATLGAALGFTAEQIDQAFRDAVQL
jgi:hypothetical protein